MARPTLTDRARYKTSSQIAKRLGIQRDTLVRRIKAGLYPPPTVVTYTGLRLFSEKWLDKIPSD